MHRPRITWNGTPDETLSLLAAFERNCACTFDAVGARTSACACHRILIEDQRALNGLLFARRMAARLCAEEWAEQPVALAS